MPAYIQGSAWLVIFWFGFCQLFFPILIVIRAIRIRSSCGNGHFETGKQGGKEGNKAGLIVSLTQKGGPGLIWFLHLRARPLKYLFQWFDWEIMGKLYSWRRGPPDGRSQAIGLRRQPGIPFQLTAQTVFKRKQTGIQVRQNRTNGDGQGLSWRRSVVPRFRRRP
jgi:hypothetical protein